MISRWARRWSSSLLYPTIYSLIRLGVTPNELTVVGLVLAVVCGFFIAVDQLLLAAFFLVLSGLSDSLDGELARTREKVGKAELSNRLGPFIDSVADHYGDFAIYFGLVWRAVHQDDLLVIFLVMAAMFGSLVGSLIRSRAGMIGIDTKNVGIFTRAERTLVLLFCLITGWMALALGLLTLASNISALQRLVFALKAKA